VPSRLHIGFSTFGLLVVVVGVDDTFPLVVSVDEYEELLS
jgi:hypothetical protein|tara:strand:- start:1992 stop:2111 length:120 start_codon:yes stop_codon:yes gene_type:complete